MVFFYLCNDSILYLIDYEKRYLDLQKNSKNFEQNEFSAKINGLNSEDREISEKNAKDFAKIFDCILHDDITVCSVPSHVPNRQETGINTMIKNLCLNGKRIDGINLLKRTKPINKIALGGMSTRKIHEESIIVKDKNLIQGKEIIIFDDIALTGNSIKYCKDLLLSLNASKVSCVVLGCVRSGIVHSDKRDLDNLIKSKISNNNSGQLLYQNYLKHKSQFPEETKIFCKAIHDEIYGSSNPKLINSGEIAVKIGELYFREIELITGTKKLPSHLRNSFIGVYLSHQMELLGYARLDKIDDHFSWYTPLLYSID